LGRVAGEGFEIMAIRLLRIERLKWPLDFLIDIRYNHRNLWHFSFNDVTANQGSEFSENTLK